MSKTIIQIYEIQTPDEAETMLSIGVDHVGSVLLDRDHWKDPAIRETRRVVETAGACSSLIPLFKDLDAICRTIDYYRPDIIHFCDSFEDVGDLEPECQKYVKLQASIKKRFPQVQIMRSIPIPKTGTAGGIDVLQWAAAFGAVSDYFLTDTLLNSNVGSDAASQPIEGFVGITGQTCNWDMAADLINQSRLPVILAGGLSPENVYEAVCRLRPAGVDSCTLTNALDSKGQPIRFKKDIDKVAHLISEVRRAEQSFGQLINR